MKIKKLEFQRLCRFFYSKNKMIFFKKNKNNEGRRRQRMASTAQAEAISRKLSKSYRP